MLVISEIKNRIAYLTLNRPDKKNALNSDLVNTLKDSLNQMANDSNVKIIIIKGNGDAFCAGADLTYLQQLQQNTFEENLKDSESLKELFEIIYYLPKIVIAQVEGHAIAGGCGLANVCDLVYAVPEAKFGYTEVKIGFIPAIVMSFLIRKIGEGKAKELLLTGKLITANEALNFGMINQIFDRENIEKEVQRIANQLCEQNSEEAMAATKLMIANIQHLPIQEALQYAAHQNAVARSSNDCKKGIASFLNKNQISW
jgi:methylglutaconyl-CoA hydratase